MCIFFYLEDISGTLPGGSDMSTGSIAGIVIGVFVLIIVIFVLLFLLYRRQQRKLLFYKHQYFLRSGEYTVSMIPFFHFLLV